MLELINEQISEVLINHLKRKVINIINVPSNYTEITDEHIYICANENCKKEIVFPEVPFFIVNNEENSYVAFHYRCAFKKDSPLFNLFSQFIDLKFF